MKAAPTREPERAGDSALGLDKIPGDADVIGVDGDSYSQVLKLRAHDIIVMIGVIGISRWSLSHELLVNIQDNGIEVWSWISIALANILAPPTHRPAPRICDTCAWIVLARTLMPDATISNGEP
jgi:hypothetical protein